MRLTIVAALQSQPQCVGWRHCNRNLFHQDAVPEQSSIVAPFPSQVAELSRTVREQAALRQQVASLEDQLAVATSRCRDAEAGAVREAHLAEQVRYCAVLFVLRGIFVVYLTGWLLVAIVASRMLHLGRRCCRRAALLTFIYSSLPNVLRRAF